MRQLKVMLFFVVAVVLVGCGTAHTVPITGRTQSLMVEDGQVLSLARFSSGSKLNSSPQCRGSFSNHMAKIVILNEIYKF